MKQKIVFPGEAITTEEEYAAGPNTFTQGGSIKSKTVGEALFNDSTKEASVKGRAVRMIKTGDIVFGKVVLVKEMNAVVELQSAENGKKITGLKTAQLPVRNVSTEFITEIKKTVKIGDLIRAKIDRISPLAIDIATNEKGLGVVKAYCSNCRQEMSYSGNKLMCLQCGSVEERRWFEAEQPAREHNHSFEREGGFERRGYGDRGGYGGRRGGFGHRSGGYEHTDRGFGERRSFGRERSPYTRDEMGNRGFGERGFRPRRNFDRGSRPRRF